MSNYKIVKLQFTNVLAYLWSKKCFFYYRFNGDISVEKLKYCQKNNGLIIYSFVIISYCKASRAFFSENFPNAAIIYA